MIKDKTITTQLPAPEESSASISAMRLRVYPSARQSSRMATWLSVAHGFRNEAVAW